jgi:hypothetical protein
MTEQEWLGSTDVGHVYHFVAGKLSERQQRLFAAACCRRLWGRIPGGAARRAVEVAEKSADSLLSADQFETARAALAAACEAAETAMTRNALKAAAEVVAEAVSPPRVLYYLKEVRWLAERVTYDPSQAGILRDVVGNPFRPCAAAPEWLAWNEGVVVALAQAAYESRSHRKGHLDPARLAILADALEDAGCSDEALLSHLRDPGPHFRGCWAVDLILGKQ